MVDLYQRDRDQGERDLSPCHMHTADTSTKYTTKYNQVKLPVAWLSLDGRKMNFTFPGRVVTSESISEPKGIGTLKNSISHASPESQTPRVSL